MPLPVPVPVPLPRYLLGGGRPTLLPPLLNHSNTGTGMEASVGAGRLRDLTVHNAIARVLLPGFFTDYLCDIDVVFKCPMCRTDINAFTGLLEPAIDADAADINRRGGGSRGSGTSGGSRESNSSRRRSNVSWFNGLFRGGGLSHPRPPLSTHINRLPPNAIRLTTRIPPIVSSPLTAEAMYANRFVTPTVICASDVVSNPVLVTGSCSVAASIYSESMSHNVNRVEGSVTEDGRDTITLPTPLSSSSVSSSSSSSSSSSINNGSFRSLRFRWPFSTSSAAHRE